MDNFQNKINDFLDYLNFEKKYSPNTVASYKKDLDKYYNFFKTKSLNSINNKDIEDYIISLNKKLLSKSVSRNISSLKTFYKFLIIDGAVKSSPMDGITVPKIPKTLPKVLSEEEVNKLLTINLETPYDYRNKAMLELMYSSGLRVSELINLAVNDVDLKDEIVKVYGKGSVMKLGEKPSLDIDVIPSGSICLDAALGIGGYPKGRIIEIYGPESSGKTTLALTAIAECQKKGGQAAFVDAEHAIDPVYASKLGVNIDELILSQPDNGEQALEIVDMLAGSEAVDIIVVDSVAALVPQAELEGGMADSNVGAHARLMSKAMRKIAGVLNKSNCTVIFINQLREKVGVMYGNPEVTTGGRALKFYASIRIDIRKAEAIKEGDKIIGNTVNIKVVKNKVAPPFKSCKVDLIFGEGFSKIGEVLDLAIENDLAKKSGSWFEILGERAGQGRDAAKQYLVDHQDVYEALVEQLHKVLGFNN